jgi:hypothetical protein
LDALDFAVPLIQGREFTLYVDFEPKGVFIAEKPVKKDLNIMSVTAYDRMIYFESFADEFLGKVTYPITLFDFLKALCAEYGVELVTTSIFNGGFVIPEKPNATNVKRRQLLQWICQLSACFGVMNADGRLELRWYKETDIILPASSIFTVDRADYTTDRLEGLQISSVYITATVPPVPVAQNVYIIEGNPLIMISDEVELYDLGAKIFDKIKDFSYIPFALSTPYFSDNKSGTGILADSGGYALKDKDDCVLLSKESRVLSDSGGYTLKDSGDYILTEGEAEKLHAGDIIAVHPRKGESFKAHIMR